MTKQKQLGAIPEAIGFISGLVITVVFGVPDELGLGSMILDAIKDSPICEGNSVCTRIPVFQALFKIIGLLLIIGSLYSIYKKGQRGKFF